MPLTVLIHTYRKIFRWFLISTSSINLSKLIIRKYGVFMKSCLAINHFTLSESCIANAKKNLIINTNSCVFLFIVFFPIITARSCMFKKYQEYKF